MGKQKIMVNFKVLIIFRIGSLGDTMVAVPSFKLIRQKYANYKIVLLTNTPVKNSVKAASSYQILNGSGLVDDYIEYPHASNNFLKLITVANEIRNMKPSMLIYLMPPRSFRQRLRDFIFFLYAGITNFCGLWIDESLNKNVFNQSAGLYESEASRLLRAVGFDSENICKDLFSINVSENEYLTAKKFVQEDNQKSDFISLSVGSKVDVKDWGEENWIVFINELAKVATGFKLLFIGSSDESLRCEKLLSFWPYGGVNLCGLLTPRLSAAALSMSKLFVGHDSGPMHLASSMGIPTVAIFASRAQKGVWFPFDNENNVLYTDISCSGCELEVCEIRAKQCINLIQPIDVLNKVKSILSVQVDY
jgi:ADP-heptose:LPS heptosyltransferase